MAAETQNTEQSLPNIVITLFSQIPIDFSEDLESVLEYKALTEDAQGICDVPGDDPFKILDHNSNESTSNTWNGSKIGRVCAIEAVLSDEYAENMELDRNEDGSVTLEECRQLRANDAVCAFEELHDFQLVFQPTHLYEKHKTPGLAVFDMDSTLIQQEVIDELAKTVGLYNEVAKVTEAAMRGELDFTESLKGRVAKLKGVHKAVWKTLEKDVITITPGARELIKVLKHLGWKTAVLSGGFIILAEWLKGELGLDYAYANQIEMDEDGEHFSGELVPGSKIVDGEQKRQFLVDIAQENGVSLEHTIAVGDGANDLLMMNKAGFGIAFNAKAKVQEAAPARLNSKSLLDIAYLLGIDQETIDAALKND